MQTVVLKKLPIRTEDYLDKSLRREARERDAGVTVDRPTIFKNEAGETLMVYDKLEMDYPDYSELVGLLQSMKFTESTRTSGMKTMSRVIGFQPRIPIRRNYCTVSSMAVEYPQTHKVLLGLAYKMGHIYRTNMQELYEDHFQAVEREVRDEWRIPGTPFTSGIVNKTVALKYHRDAGNFKGVRSAMLVVRQGTKGGALCLPEYGVKLECADRAVVIFDGSKELHGVTPIVKMNQMGFRYSIVFYSLLGMRLCETFQQEIQRVREQKREKEKRRATGV